MRPLVIVMLAEFCQLAPRIVERNKPLHVQTLVSPTWLRPSLLASCPFRSTMAPTNMLRSACAFAAPMLHGRASCGSILPSRCQGLRNPTDRSCDGSPDQAHVAACATNTSCRELAQQPAHRRRMHCRLQRDPAARHGCKCRLKARILWLSDY
jgi:hypothetical protein